MQQADLWDNGYDNIGVPRQSTYARFIFTTNAPSITVTGDTTLAGTSPGASLGVIINGVNQPDLVLVNGGSQSFIISLGSAGTVRTVEIISGVESLGTDPVITGTYIDSIAYPVAAAFTVSPPVVSNRVVVYGDSIAVGAGATDPLTQSYVSLLRNQYGQSILLEAWSARSMSDDVFTPTQMTTFINRLVSYKPSTLYMAIGTMISDIQNCGMLRTSA